ncbi:MAG TPA: hypothetical protein PLB87_05040, partial [Prolixibacteraceae bacterium]|nr:hypothetical protein [Prolixibacteraceae bacterium]
MKQKKRNVSRMTVFRRWNNKGYAVFNSLKRVVKIGCLMAIYLRFANHDVLAARVGADTTSVTQRIDLNEITVSADLPAETYSNISRVVVSVTPKEIERAAVSSVNELLEYASNIDIR